ncbi:uncharacterized protein LOC126780084 isoform X2 [Nymphalis io]|uniref:uncharacterized protein LOC126780084 isoform X2 n=1 Tax=Inachis io TaxID=171585 RepID=UPI002168082B|nr:uncharacterized protein LOC126780084 isoform X2 [Nymphalis io]
MSTLQDSQSFWNISSDNTDLKYEKCRNITEEIYKRIDITFKIKKLETGTQSESDYSDQIDSNELSNETDLFACDKSSISSSTDLEALELGSAMCEKFINNNNNEETKKKTTTVYKRPRKRFRKRVKKQQRSKRESDGSSDEAPLSRVADLDFSRESRVTPSPSHAVMGVPNVVITPIDLKKFKLPLPEKKSTKKNETKCQSKEPKDKTTPSTIDKPMDDRKQTIDKTDNEKEKSMEWNCSICSLSFRGERGLRRHMTMSHIINPHEAKKSNKKEETT